MIWTLPFLVGIVWLSSYGLRSFTTLVLGMILGVVLSNLDDMKRACFPPSYAGGYKELNHRLLNLGGAAGGPAWLNLGLWQSLEGLAPLSYAEACEGLARKLGDAAQLGPGDHLLDVGVGCGAQDHLFKARFGVSKITAINLAPSEVSRARGFLQRQGYGEEVAVRVGSATCLPQAKAGYDVVLSLDSAYHYDTRHAFLRQAMNVLKPGGRLGVADMVMTAVPTSMAGQAALSAWCWTMGLPKDNMHDLQEYKRRLDAAGFVDVRVEDISDHVYSGFGEFVERHYDVYRGITNRWVWGMYRASGWLSSWNHRHRIMSFHILTAFKPLQP